MESLLIGYTVSRGGHWQGDVTPARSCISVVTHVVCAPAGRCISVVTRVYVARGTLDGREMYQCCDACCMCTSWEMYQCCDTCCMYLGGHWMAGRCIRVVMHVVCRDMAGRCISVVIRVVCISRGTSAGRCTLSTGGSWRCWEAEKEESS